MPILNYKNLAKSPLRKNTLEIIKAGLEAIDTKKAVRKHVRIKSGFLVVNDEKILLKGVGRIFVVAVGKCANDAFEALKKILKNKIHAGITVDIRKGKKFKKIKSFAGSHPFPSE